MTSPLLGRPGAVEADGLDAGVAWHYGHPVAEQRELLSGAAITDLSNRGVVTLTGPDRLTWLDTLSTQWLRDLEPGQSREALILSPKGHIENALHVVDDGQTTWLTVEPGAAEPLVAHLERMKFMLRVEIVDRSADVAVLGYRPGGDAEISVRSQVPALAPVWDDPWPTTVGDTFTYNPISDADHPGAQRPWRELLLTRADLAGLLDTDVPVAGSWAAEALRVAALRPRFGRETDHRTIPHELDWLRTAVHLQKGCYRGQETVARVKNLGRPPRRLVFLHLDGSEHALPERDSEVRNGDRVVGKLTSVVNHHDLGPIGLALVKRSVPVDDALLVGGIAAAQQVVVAP